MRMPWSVWLRTSSTTTICRGVPVATLRSSTLRILNVGGRRRGQPALFGGVRLLGGKSFVVLIYGAPALMGRICASNAQASVSVSGDNKKCPRIAPGAFGFNETAND